MLAMRIQQIGQLRLTPWNQLIRPWWLNADCNFPIIFVLVHIYNITK